MTTAIKVEHLSKLYRLGQIGTGTISQDVQRWITTKVLGKEDPFLKIGQSNDRTTKGESDVVYSLQDINFEIEQGDAVGIIGRNGAGKSTLLKILSRVTAPTTGRINVKGRVASLLEVGTGFHPELTGRENIYLNGAILGMRKKEITRKLDEIIDFSGVERYIDTPVKRYSSGMYVRLAFAVAAHLESEILIVDEVLAVGDAEFQKKCLGKMGDVRNKDGRTVLFVSHNMASVESLCQTGIVLKDGQVNYIGNATNSIKHYLKLNTNNTVVSNEMSWDIQDAPGNNYVKLLNIAIDPLNGDYLNVASGHKITVDLWNEKIGTTLGFNMQIFNEQEICVYTVGKIMVKNDSQKGIYKIETKITDGVLNRGQYKCKIWIGELGSVLCLFEDILIFEVLGKTLDGVNSDRLPGITFPNSQIDISFKN